MPTDSAAIGFSREMCSAAPYRPRVIRQDTKAPAATQAHTASMMPWPFFTSKPNRLSPGTPDRPLEPPVKSCQAMTISSRTWPMPRVARAK